MGADAPTPTSPQETAKAQTGANVSTAIANNMMQNATLIGADGSKRQTSVTGNYTFKDPYTGMAYDIPTYTQTESLSPIKQQAFDQNNLANLNLSKLGNQTSEQLLQSMSKPLTAADLGARPELGQLKKSYDTEFTADRQRTEDALMSRMAPQLQRDRSALETQLSNQGIKLGTGAYSTALQNFGQKENDARMAAILSSGQEQSRLAGLARDSASFGNSATLDQYNAGLAGRGQKMQESFALDNQQVNKAMALASGTQVAMPQFSNFNSAKIPTTDNAGIISNYDNQNMQAWQQNTAQQNQLIGGLMGGASSLASAGIMKYSDERLKENIEPVGTLKGHKIYEYDMKDTGEHQIGVMAQEVRKKQPSAVKKDSKTGYLKVDYGKLFHARAV